MTVATGQLEMADFRAVSGSSPYRIKVNIMYDGFVGSTYYNVQAKVYWYQADLTESSTASSTVDLGKYTTADKDIGFVWKAGYVNAPSDARFCKLASYWDKADSEKFGYCDAFIMERVQPMIELYGDGNVEEKVTGDLPLDTIDFELGTLHSVDSGIYSLDLRADPGLYYITYNVSLIIQVGYPISGNTYVELYNIDTTYTADLAPCLLRYSDASYDYYLASGSLMLLSSDVAKNFELILHSDTGPRGYYYAYIQAIRLQ